MLKENFMILKSLIKIKKLVISELEKEMKTTPKEMTNHVQGIICTLQSENKILGRIIKTEKIE